ncbi:MOSC domain-containing protein [Luteipulveratus sp. YIM 133132]|uniref:MOSC domain-containing protein n=1 Tax=Luteipulveratus flavus TaxID=3031728 RepID=A0ABT6C261_9MICO|nr:MULTISPECIES: MOSC domain-containing protein [unclassified Luteipulveratus]MDE9367013.1 MOSC domain-containing protein [Luteipulveratus sp. YIM 133132]MDF8262998.1 MOSC domain-containing protein [Luteipulveratus sp. YIM 133296]
MPQVISVNVGSPQPTSQGKRIPTGIGKHPVEHVDVRDPGPKHGGEGSGAVGDFIGDRRHHGGSTQALYAFAREELDAWEARLGRDLPSGTFGENLTTVGYDVDASRIGDRWRIGPEVVVVVTGPRIPCSTFAARMGERGWVKTFAAHGRSGAYLAVETPGRITTGDEVAVVSRADHDITVPVALGAFMGDLDAADEVLAAGVLVPDEHAALERTVRRRRNVRR